MEAFQAWITPLDDQRCQLELAGEVDLAAAAQIVDLGLVALAGPGIIAVVVSLGRVTFIDSTALGALVRLRNAALSQSKRLELTEVPARVERLLELTGLSGVFSAETGDHPAGDQTGS